MMSRINQQGDTLVEVLFATVVLSIVLAGAFTLSNRATKINQEAFERSQVSNVLQEQVELVRAARDSFDSGDISAPESVAWNAIRLLGKPGVLDLGTTCDDLSVLGTQLTARDDPFYIDAQSGTIDVISNNFVTVTTPNNIFNVWMEADNGSGYTDIHAFACWEGLSSEVTERAAIIMRLEDPS